MAFTPYDIDIGKNVNTYTITGLTPGKQYSFTVTPKNSIGPGPASNTVTVTQPAQQTSSAPALVQKALFRDNGSGSASFSGSITLSLPNPPNPANRIYVFMADVAENGTGSANVLGPSSATRIAGPIYDTNTGVAPAHVTYCWEIKNDASNNYTFINYNSSDWSGWKIIEVSGVSAFDYVHGPAQETSTAVTWPVSAPTSGTNCLRFANITSNNVYDTVATSATVVPILTDSRANNDLYHAGFLATVSPTFTGTASVTVSPANGTNGDNPVYGMLTVYGTSIPAQVTSVAASNITAIGCTLSWTNQGFNTDSYLIDIIGGGAIDWTHLATIDGTASSTAISGLQSSTDYQFRITAASATGIGTASTAVAVRTLDVQPLLPLQTASASGSSGGSGVYTLNATMTNATRVGSTLAFFYSGFADGNNITLSPPFNATNATGLLQDNGPNTDPICMGWIQQVTTPGTSYSYAGTDDQACLIVEELQGVTSIGTPLHGGNLSFVDGASGHVIVPIAAPGATPAVSLVFINMTTDVDTWGTMPAGVTLLKGFTGNSLSPTYHHGALLQVASTVSGNITIPYTLGNSKTQASPPTYIQYTFYGSSATVAPGAITLTRGTATVTSQSLGWTAPASGSATGYQIEYAGHGLNNWAAYGSQVTGTSLTINGLAASTNYDYRVTPYNGSTAGPVSNIVSGYTLPGQVTGLALGQSTSTTQQLSWTALSGTITSYTLQYKKASDPTFTNITGIVTTTDTVSGLTASTSYVFQVFGLNGTTAGATSTPVSTITPAPIAPTQPTNLTAGLTTDSTQALSWNASSGTVTSYTVQYSSTSSGGPWTSVNGVSGTSTVVSGLSPNTVYYYQVIAYNVTTPSPASPVIVQPTVTTSPPGQITNLTAAIPGATYQTLSWGAPTGNVTTYVVQYKVANASTFNSFTGITGTSFTVQGLSPATPYTFQVYAVNNGAAGIASIPVMTTTSTAHGTHPILVGGHPITVGGKPVEL